MDKSLVADLGRSVVLAFVLAIIVGAVSPSWPLAIVFGIATYSLGGSAIFLAFRIPNVLKADA